MAGREAGELPSHSISGGELSRLPSCINGGELSRLTSCTDAAQVKLVRRKPDGLVRWELRQSRATVIWTRCTMERQRLETDGFPIVRKTRTIGSRLYVVPAQATFTGEVEINGDFEYTMLDLNDDFLKDWPCLDRFFEGPVSPEITRCLSALTSEASAPDNFFDLLAASWLVQTLAFLTRMTKNDLPAAKLSGGLTARDCRRLEDYIRTHLADGIRISSLAKQVDLGERHFTRVFSQMFNETPAAYISRLRIEKAKNLLTSTRLSMTDIALECGFSHAQHFSTKFHDVVGASPSRFRLIVTS